MPIRRRTLLPIVLSLVAAVAFARLGFWQLSRLAERRAYNTHLAERLAAPPVVVTSLSSDSGSGHYRRVTARGVYDYSAQVALAPRSREGSPGVHVLTPLRLAGGTIVMVNRGWVYSPDAQTIDPAKWREHEGDTVAVVGYAETWAGVPKGERRNGLTSAGEATRSVKVLDSALVAGMVGAPIQRYYLVQTSDSATRPSVPVRLGEPSLDEGSHRNYAIQWFSFTFIAIVGGSLIVRQDLVDDSGS